MPGRRRPVAHVPVSNSWRRPADCGATRGGRRRFSCSWLSLRARLGYQVGPDCVAGVRAWTAQCLHRHCSRLPACPTLPEPRRRRAGHDEPGDLRKRFRRRLCAWPRAESRRVGGESDQRSERKRANDLGSPHSRRSALEAGSWRRPGPVARWRCRRFCQRGTDLSLPDCSGCRRSERHRQWPQAVHHRLGPEQQPGVVARRQQAGVRQQPWRSLVRGHLRRGEEVDLVCVAERRFRHEPDVVARRNEDRVHPQAWNAVRPPGAGRL